MSSGETGPVRWGICATGAITEKFVDGLRLVDDAEVVAVGSRSQESADAFGERFDIGRRYGSYEALAADDEVDVVYIASTQNAHHPNTMLFLNAGRHVLCEKPFARSAAELAEMVALATDKKLFLMEAIWSRFLPSYVRLRELLAAGAIGEPRMVEADFGFRIPSIDPDHRLFDPERAGGGLLDLGIYPVQLASMVLGDPDQVKGVGHIGETGVDEQVAMVLHHDGGALAVLHASIRTSTSCGARIAGTEGTITIPAFMHVPQALHLDNSIGTGEEIDLPMEGNGYHYQVLEVHRCLREGRLQSDLLALDERLTMMTTLDQVRADIGLTYPGEASPGKPGGA